MQVSREIDYGMRAVLVMAMNGFDRISKRTIAGKFNIPVNFLAIILPKLVHCGIVESIPGQHGGYRLAKPAKDISMFDVVKAIDDCFAFNRCLDEARGCEYSVKCPVHPHWRHVQDDVDEYLRHITFDKLADDFKRNN